MDEPGKFHEGPATAPPVARSGNRGRGVLWAVAFAIGALGVLTTWPSPGAAQTVLKIGVYQNPPKLYLDEQERPKGMYVDLIGAIAKATDLQFEYVPCSWNECLNWLETGRLDVMPDVAYSPERAQRFRFSKVPVFHGWSVVYVHSRSGIESLVDLDRKRVAALRGGAQETEMTKLAAEYGIRPSLIQYESFERMFEDLRDRKVDAALFNRFVGQWRAREYGVVQTPVIFAPSTNFIAYSKALDPAISERIDLALREQVETPRSEYEQALKRWFYDYHPPAVPLWLYWTAGITTALLLTAVAFAWLLRRTVRLQTAELRDKLTEVRRKNEQLAQAQKMEAVGQLTGGLAHDFNNRLAAVMTNLELLEDHVAPQSEARELIASAIRSAERGAELTRRLLVFSRSHELRPKVVNVNRTIAGMTDLLRRTLGEKIAIRTELSGDLWSTNVDPGQLENTILNLALNARDAMPEGGTLILETRNVELDQGYAEGPSDVGPGAYVLLAVTDTGTGMTPDVRARAFEPFFTTKTERNGSGLGLSMIYGFVKESGGHIEIQSEPGDGASIRIYLPRDVRVPIEEPLAERGPGRMSAKGTVLVVEDDDEVRDSVEKVLRSIGYDVLSASSGHDALEIIGRTRRIDLLLTDVGLPRGMNGTELARRARSLLPGLRVLYISGYTHGALDARDLAAEGFELIGKPFRRAELETAVRRVLDMPRVA